MKAITHHLHNSTTVGGPELPPYAVGSEGEEIGPSVQESEPITASNPRKAMSLLNKDQTRAHTIIKNHLLAHMAIRKPKQLLMMVIRPGGTGKTLLISTITETFRFHGVTGMLAKTASTGVAASLIGGETLHAWAGIPIAPSLTGDWTKKGLNKTIMKHTKNIGGLTAYLAHDKTSMTTKSILACLSQAASKVRAGKGTADRTAAFGRLNVILFSDFHQFPPVNDPSGALYCDRPLKDKPRALIGREIYLQFDKVVILKELK